MGVPDGLGPLVVKKDRVIGSRGARMTGIVALRFTAERGGLLSAKLKIEIPEETGKEQPLKGGGVVTNQIPETDWKRQQAKKVRRLAVQQQQTPILPRRRTKRKRVASESVRRW